MDNKTKLRLGGLILLTTAVLSLIIVLIVDSWYCLPSCLPPSSSPPLRAALFGHPADSNASLSNV